MYSIESSLRKFAAYKLYSCRYCYSSKIPSHPCWIHIDASSLPQVDKVDQDLVNQLEKLSLLKLSNEHLNMLSCAIISANKLQIVNTDEVKPLYSVLEDRSLFLRNDDVTEGNCKNDILRNAVKTEEEYFVIPSGMSPFEEEETIDNIKSAQDQ